MGTTLVIAEKPSVGKDIARVLGCRQKGEHWLYNDEYIVSWAVGHLVTLLEPEDYNPSYKKWAGGTLPIIPDKFQTKPISKTRAQFNVLKKLMNDKSVDRLVSATDSGREGELIFRYIYELAKCRKPWTRLWISSMTDTAIKNGFAKMKDGRDYDKLYASARCRAEADWLVGMNATRAYTLAYGTLLSVGRVQTPTLAMLVNRQAEINAFKPQDYFEVKATFKTGNGITYTGLWQRPEAVKRVSDRQATAPAIQTAPASQTAAATKQTTPATQSSTSTQTTPASHTAAAMQQTTPTTQNSSAMKSEHVTRNKTASQTTSAMQATPATQNSTAQPSPDENSPNSRHRINDEASAKAIADKVRNQPGHVADIKKEVKKNLPPQLFDLTELQRECNKRLNFSATKTLQIAQALYEKHKLITYPRTDSRFLSHDMTEKLPLVIKAFAHTEPYKDAAGYLLSLPELPITARIVNDAKVTDHHAIIPTGKTSLPASMTADERAVYDRIVRKFLAVFMPAHTYEATTVLTSVMGETFRSSGNVTLEEGWTKLYADERKTGATDDSANKQAHAFSDMAVRVTDATDDNANKQANAFSDMTVRATSTADDTANKQSHAFSDKSARATGAADDSADAQTLPPLAKGEAVDTVKADVLKKQTQPPKPHTEATLLSAMEHAGRELTDEALKESLKDSGLGTPATRAAIIERLIAVGYVERKLKSLIPTEKGIRLISVVPHELRSPETTGKWERGLSRIARGEMDPARFMESITRYVHYLVDSAATQTR
jgi:DNA topoisomerase-3